MVAVHPAKNESRTVRIACTGVSTRILRYSADSASMTTASSEKVIPGVSVVLAMLSCSAGERYPA
jgi:hypothetical protein